MPSVTNQSTARYLASKALLDGGFTHEQVGRALLALEGEPEPEIDEPSEKDLHDYELYREWLEYARDCGTWTTRQA